MTLRRILGLCIATEIALILGNVGAYLKWHSPSSVFAMVWIGICLSYVVGLYYDSRARGLLT